MEKGDGRSVRMGMEWVMMGKGVVGQTGPLNSCRAPETPTRSPITTRNENIPERFATRLAAERVSSPLSTLLPQYDARVRRFCELLSRCGALSACGGALRR